MKTVLTIAGSDPSGGAGIQVDLQTFHTLGVHGLTAITAVTAQNEKRFFSLNPLLSRLVREQIHSVSGDQNIDAIKIGMLGTEDNVYAVHRFLEQSKVTKVVLDPVLRSSTGAILLDPKGIAIMKNFLIPRSMIVTPNLDEAEVLTGMKIRSIEAMKEAAFHLHTVYKGVKSVLIKGGHLKEDKTDVLYDGRDWTLFPSRRKFPRDVHGTGCALSASIAAHFARGYSLEKSVALSKEYISTYIRTRS